MVSATDLRRDGFFFISTNGGSSWQTNGFPQAYWTCLACSANGSTRFCGGSQLEISTNSGATWSYQPYSGLWSILCSADGKKVMMSASGPGRNAFAGLCTSPDAGATWVTNKGLPGPIDAFAVS